MHALDDEEALAFLREPGVLPLRALATPDEPQVLLVDAGREPFVGAFLQECVSRAQSTVGRFPRRMRARLAAIAPPLAFDDAVPLAGMVFHVSRCGSSLPVRILQADPSIEVIAESDALDAVAIHLPLGEEQRVARMRAMVATYARRRTPTTTRLVLKLDAWHLRDHALFRRAFPDVPFVVIVRDPLEVAVSLQRRRGSQVVPGQLPLRLLGIAPDDFQPHELDRYMALVLRGLYESAAQAVAAGGLLVDYEAFPDAALTTIPAHFGLALDPAAHARAEALRTEHAKQPNEAFEDDRAWKRAAADDALRALVDTYVRPAYAALVGG